MPIATEKLYVVYRVDTYTDSEGNITTSMSCEVDADFDAALERFNDYHGGHYKVSVINLSTTSEAFERTPETSVTLPDDGSAPIEASVE